MTSDGRLVVTLKAVRTEKGLSQGQLAERVGVSRKTINTVENGIYVPTTTLALKLADELGCSVEQLFSLPKPSPPTPAE